MKTLKMLKPIPERLAQGHTLLPRSCDRKREDLVQVCARSGAGVTRSDPSLDIFSLGCVFLEMLAVLCIPMQRHVLLETRKQNPDNDWSYQANIETILAGEPFCSPRFVDDRCYAWLEEAKKMIHLDPQNRPTAEVLREVFGKGQDCCYRGFVPFEAAEHPYKLPIPGMDTDELEVEPEKVPSRKRSKSFTSNGFISNCYCGRGSCRAYERCTYCLREAGYIC